MLPQEPLNKFIDAMIAAPLNEDGNFARVEDATYAVHELTAVFAAMLELPATLGGVPTGVPIGAMLREDDLYVIQMMLAALHAQSCTPERKQEAAAYAAQQVAGMINSIIKGITETEVSPAPPEEGNVELSPKLAEFLSTLEGESKEEK